MRLVHSEQAAEIVDSTVEPYDPSLVALGAPTRVGIVSLPAQNRRRRVLRQLHPLAIPLAATALFLAMPFLGSLALVAAVGAGIAPGFVVWPMLFLSLALGVGGAASGFIRVIDEYDPSLGAYLAIMGPWLLLFMVGLVPLSLVLTNSADPISADQILPIILSEFV